MYVVLVYDISQEKNGAKRWSKVFKISKVSALSKGGFSMHTNPVIMIARC